MKNRNTFRSFTFLVLFIFSLDLYANESKNIKTQKQPTKNNENYSVSKSERYESLELFQKVLHFVENNYVEETKNKDLIYGAIKGMLETLDPHSNFLNAEVFQDMKVDTSGKFGGVGIEIGVKDGILTVIAPIEDTPAWKAGLKPGDRITKINGESTKGMTMVEAISKMRGKRGTSVNVDIFRAGFSKPKEIVLNRELIKIQSVKFEEIEPGFGWVRLTNFNENAAKDIQAAIKNLESKRPLKGLVLDLRTNPGGLLDQAVEVSSLFIDEGVIVSTKGRNKDEQEIKYAKKGSARKDFALAVLVNGSSASASEIVAGALQDHHRAIIMGSTTFGKGSVQSVIDLGQNLGLKLTIARYYTPSGRSIQERGVVPDIQLDDFDTKLLAEARKSNETIREKDLKRHIANTDDDDPEEFKAEELQQIATLSSEDKKADNKKGAPGASPNLKIESEMEPIRFNAKSDYQVKEAVNYLKSYEFFKKMSTSSLPPSGERRSHFESMHFDKLIRSASR